MVGCWVSSRALAVPGGCGTICWPQAVTAPFALEGSCLMRGGLGTSQENFSQDQYSICHFATCRDHLDSMLTFRGLVEISLPRLSLVGGSTCHLGQNILLGKYLHILNSGAIRSRLPLEQQLLRVSDSSLAFLCCLNRLVEPATSSRGHNFWCIPEAFSES